MTGDHRHYADMDTHDEVIALYRSVFRGDAEARDAILDGTFCAACLALGAAQFGLWITTRAPDLARKLGVEMFDIQRELASDA